MIVPRRFVARYSFLTVSVCLLATSNVFTQDADQPAGYISSAHAAMQAGRYAEAANIFDRQLAANPRSDSGAYALAAWSHLKNGDNARAADICEQGMRLYPDSDIEGVYLSLPRPFLVQRVSERIKALQNSTPNVGELIALGRVLVDADPDHKTRANEIAEKLLSQAMALAPSSASARYNYGRALSVTNLERGLAEWEKALELLPDDELRLQILMKIGAAKLELADFDGTERAYKTALEINRRLPHHDLKAALEYVRFLQMQPRQAEAEELLRQVLAWNPLSPEAHAEKARLLANKREWEKAVEEGEFVLRTADDNQELLRLAHLLLARAYHALNQPDKAQLHQSWLEKN